MSFVRSLARLRSHEPDEPPTWAVVGLGNPGGQYARTRHNVGFICTNALARRLGVRFHHNSKLRADVAHVNMKGHSVLLAQPQTFMNESGTAVSRMVRRYSLAPDRILLVYDDVDLPFGIVRVRQGGSSGGQKGVQSTIDAMRTADIPRVRIGIGRSARATRDHVLSEFASDERQLLPKICEMVSEIIQTAVSEDVVVAMNRFNGIATMPITAS